MLKRDMDQLDEWLEVRRPVLEDRTLGDSIDAVEDQLQKHDDFEKMILAQEDRFNTINRNTLVGHSIRIGGSAVAAEYAPCHSSVTITT